MYVNDSHVYLSRPYVHPVLRPLIAVPGQYILFDISAWIANEHLKLNMFKTELLMPRCPKPLPSVVFLISVLVTAVFQLLKMEFWSLSFPHNPLCIHWTISVAIPQKHVRNLCLLPLLPPLSPSLSYFLGYFISFSLSLCSLFTAQQPNPTTYLLKTLRFKFPSSEALFSFLGLFLLLLLFSHFLFLNRTGLCTVPERSRQAFCCSQWLWSA